MNTGTAGNEAALKRYYRFHSVIYDITRWSFLFGRRELVRRCRELAHPRSILDVGCGTGAGLVLLAESFPESTITGIDLSTDMLSRARARVATAGPRIRVQEGSYGAAAGPEAEGSAGLIVFSYSLSMFNPGREAALDRASRQLGEGGLIAAVDFHYSRYEPFRRWMLKNHVNMDGRLLPALEARFDPLFIATRPVYGSLWEYFMFIGRKK